MTAVPPMFASMRELVGASHRDDEARGRVGHTKLEVARERLCVREDEAGELRRVEDVHGVSCRDVDTVSVPRHSARRQGDRGSCT